MNYSRVGLLFISLIAAVTSVAVVVNAIVQSSAAHETNRSLLIERSGNEPLELVDLRLREKSVKSGIHKKIRAGDDGYDQVGVGNAEEWSKHLRVRLRNVSGKRIVGFEAYLYFKPVGADMYFSANLKAAGRLEHTALSAGEEIEAKVDEDAWNRARMRLWRYGADFNTAEVVFSVGIVAFDDGLEWHKGHTLRVDPDNPKRHIPVESKEPLDLGDLGARLQPRFQSVAFAPRDRTRGKSAASILNPGPAQSLTKCVNDNGSLDAPHCQDDPNSENCFTLNFMSPGSIGTKTRFPVPGDCRVIPSAVDRGIVCTADTTHQIFFTDPDCNPTPTPTISCLPAGAVFTEGLLPCCPGLTVVGNTCTVAGPTPDACATATPRTCPPGESSVFFGPPFCYVCLPNLFPMPSPSPSPTCAGVFGACFVTPCCPGLTCNGISCVLSGPTPTPVPCTANNQTCFVHGACCSGFCDPSTFKCAAQPTPTPPECDNSGCGACCEGNICGDQSGACIPCVPDWRGRGDCTTESCQQCYDMGGTSCTGSGGDCWTPIVIDVLGNGFDLTNLENGIDFDDGTGHLLRTAWTNAWADDAWLVLDRNGNGTIDDARELFGSAAPQPPPPPGEIKHGFRALAEFDKRANGGNANGLIEERDAIFPQLRLWEDGNHNGISENWELRSLSAVRLEAISVDYRESRRRDRWGNGFRYRAKVYGERRSHLGRWAFDVFLLSEYPTFSQTQKFRAAVELEDFRSLLRLSGIDKRRVLLSSSTQ